MAKNMNRREFMKAQIWGAAWLATGAAGLIVPGRATAESTPDVGVVTGTPSAATRGAVDLLGGMQKFVKPGQRVIIKPNMSFISPPERASNTHPEVVRELVVLCKEAGADKILVLDNPLGPGERCIESSGILEACKAIDEKMVYAVKDFNLYKEVSIPQGQSMTKNAIMREVLKSDVLIAAPVAKSHSGTGVSLSMKGMMGLVYNRRDMHGPYDLSTSIVDLSTVLKADLVVIDATRVLTTNGPRGPGKVFSAKTVIASRDMVAADAYAVSQFEWYGRRYKAGQVAHIREAHERGLGRMDVENLRVKTRTL
jgi:uncharacterized protein (DUF362 family)